MSSMHYGLPIEIWGKIATHLLDPRDISNFSETSKVFANLVESLTVLNARLMLSPRAGDNFYSGHFDLGRLMPKDAIARM